jgi:hypothetical protein
MFSIWSSISIIAVAEDGTTREQKSMQRKATREVHSYALALS